MIGWAHPVLINLLRYQSVSLFIDGTFRCVPRHFQQCVIVMVSDRASGLFVPVFYVLCTDRTADTYWDVVDFVYHPTHQQLDPESIVCDFEQGLIDAVATQFPQSRIVGCLFHLKQALRRKMLALHIPRLEISIAMRHGVIDTLTVLAYDKISQGITWVQAEIIRLCGLESVVVSAAKWLRF